MNDLDSKHRALNYCEARNYSVDFGNQLGVGQEGFVWKTDYDSAIKVFDRIGNFEREIQCYRILSEHKVTEVEGFNIPQLVGEDADLRVIELTIVAAPYILDFGKAWVHRRPDYSS